MESAVGIQWAYSLKSQSDYPTPNPDADIDQSHPFEGADIGDHTVNMVDNAALYGKGHEFATREYLLSWDTRFRRQCFLTSKIAGWGFAFHCGQVTTTAAAPGFHHVFEYQDPNGTGYYGSGRQLPVSTIIERVTSGLQRKFPSMLVSAIELTGAMNDFCHIAMDLVGSGAMERLVLPPGFTFPTGAAANEGERLRNTAMLFEVGETGDLLDISCDVRSWRFRSEYALAEADGYCPGSGYLVEDNPLSGQIRNKLEFLRRACLLEWVVRASADNTIFTQMEGLVNLAANITLTGGPIGVGPAVHKVVIKVPQINYRAIPIGVDGDLIIYSIQTVIRYDDTLANPWEVSVDNDTTEYLVPSAGLLAAPGGPGAAQQQPGQAPPPGAQPATAGGAAV